MEGRRGGDSSPPRRARDREALCAPGRCCALAEARAQALRPAGPEPGRVATASSVMGDRPAADRRPAARPVVGLIVNPVAGLGGTVGLKGSDTRDVQRTALAAGAIPNASERTFHALRPLRPLRPTIEILTVRGDMGEAAARRAGFDPRIVDCAAATPSSGEDTRRAARAMADGASACCSSPAATGRRSTSSPPSATVSHAWASPRA